MTLISNVPERPRGARLPFHPAPRVSPFSLALYPRVPTAPGDPGDRARNRRLYGRTPVIGWPRFIDGGISPFERAFRARRAARSSACDPDFRRISEGVATAFFEFPFTRDGFRRSGAVVRAAHVAVYARLPSSWGRLLSFKTF